LQEHAPEYFDVMPRTILATITGKSKRCLTADLDYKEEMFDLDGVESEFLACVGDKCMLDCKVQRDNSFLDSNGEILTVIRLRPTKTFNDFGRITLFKDQCGVISNKYLFYADVLEAGYKRPNVGDKVKFTTVETTDIEFVGMLFYERCIKVEPVELKENVLNKINQSMAEPELNSTLSLNKNGIVISADLSFVLCDIRDKSVEAKELIIENTSAFTHKLIGVAIRCQKKISQFKVVSPSVNEKFDMQPGEKLIYKIAARPQFHGAYSEAMVFAFVDGKDSQKFTIGRYLKIEVADVDHAYPSQGTGPVFRNTQYTAQVANAHRRIRDVIPGQRVAKTPNFIDIKIGSYHVPDHIKQAVLR
jgi:hypothetical protein